MSGSNRSFEVGPQTGAPPQVDMLHHGRNRRANGWFTTDVSGMRVHWLPVRYSNHMNYPPGSRIFKFAIRAAGRARRVEGDVVLAPARR